MFATSSVVQRMRMRVLHEAFKLIFFYNLMSSTLNIWSHFINKQNRTNKGGSFLTTT
jgi:hypothetical protein